MTFPLITTAKITVRNQFIAHHRWKTAREPRHGFLQYWHRHVFHVATTFNVRHNDREIEFFDAQTMVQEIIEAWKDKQVDKSCEMFATEILHRLFYKGLDVVSCTVGEDGENEATVEIIALDATEAKPVKEGN